MKRILVRSGEDPLVPSSPKTKAVRTGSGDNFGNFLFSAAAHKLLSGAGREVTSHGTGRLRPSDPHDINERFDVLVLPFANAIRPSFERRLLRYTELIEQLDIPVVVLGIGAQSTLDYDLEMLRPLEGTARRFMRAVLERSPSVGVRGEFTEAFLRKLGFDDIEVIGCPSMFMYGDQLTIDDQATALSSDARVAINASRVPGMSDIVRYHGARYPNLRYLCQDREELDLLLWGTSFDGSVEGGGRLPSDPTDELYRSDRLRMCTDPWTWLAYLRTFSFSFGARIHGNIASLLAGTPTVVLAHDSRTLELARYFEIPHVPMSGPPTELDAAKLYITADHSGLQRNHAERFERMVRFMGVHGLDHIFSEPSDVEAFEMQVARTKFAPPVGPRRGLDGTSWPARVRRLGARCDRELRTVATKVGDRLR